jgi:uncharacterized protein YacL
LLKGKLWFQVVSALLCAVGVALGLPRLLGLFYNYALRDTDLAERAARSVPILLACIALGALVGALLGNVLAKGQQKWSSLHIGDKVTQFIGVVVGIIVSLPFLVFIGSANLLLWGQLAMLVTLAAFIFLSLYALRSLEEVLPWNRGNFKGTPTGIKILDTNVIIDGRIYDVARSGFLEGELYVPGFVLEELQHIADSGDPLRRQRGRRGLDILRLMQADFPLEVRVHDKLVAKSTEDVDNRLVRLARLLGADIVTNDFNLNRVAALQDVKVLNLNDLSLAVRPNVLPQESLVIMLVREGNQVGQGVGYLEDGTMVVVENGKAHIGETVEVMVTQVIQTERGKMIFAEVQDGANSHSVEFGTRRRVTPRRSE